MEALMQSITTLIKENEVIAGMIGIYSAGIVTYLLRNIPTKVGIFLKRHLTTSLVITSQHLIFYDFMRWSSGKFKDKKYRTIKVSNGRYGDDKGFIKSIGYGGHWLFYQGYLLYITLAKEQANNTAQDKESIIIEKLGRSHNLFNRMLKDLSSPTKVSDKTEVYRYEGRWALIKEQHKRSLKSIFIEKDKMLTVIKRINKFINEEDWYVEHGIPYQLGILLYGEPGTGKSSIVRALASYLSYNIYYLDTMNVSRTEEAMSRLPEKAIMVIEDIDSSTISHRRAPKKNVDGPGEVTAYSGKSPSDEIWEAITSSSLSGVLNALDGIFAAHGRILIMTTNHIEKLDPALIREGRVDIKLNVGYINSDILHQFMEVYYPDECDFASSSDVKTGHTIAELQELLIQGKTGEEIIDICGQNVNKN